MYRTIHTSVYTVHTNVYRYVKKYVYYTYRVERPDHLLDDGEREFEVSDGESALIELGKGSKVVVFFLRAKDREERGIFGN